MGKLRLILGGSGYGKTKTLFDGVVRAAEQDFKKNYIVVVPEQASHAVTDDFLRATRGHGILNIDVLGFARFAHRIFSSAGGNKATIIDDTGKNLILRRIAEEKKQDLNVLSGSLRKQGYISEIKSVISELIQYDIPPEKVTEPVNNSGVHRYLEAKLADISVLYKAFKERMGNEFITQEELLDHAIRYVEKAGFLKNAVIVFDSFTGFTPIQYRFIAKLMEVADEIAVCLDYDGEDGEFFNLSIMTIAELRALAEKAEWDIETVHCYDTADRRLASRPDLDFLEKHIFRKNYAVYDGEVENIHLVNAVNPVGEVAFVCSKIAEIVREGKTRYKECGIVMSDVDAYGSILEREARRYDIPLFIDKTSSIELNPFVEFIRAAIAVETAGFSYESVFHFLKTGLSDFSDEEIDLTENYVRAMNIRGRRKYKEPWVWHTQRISEDELSTLNSVRQRIADQFAPLDELMQSRNVTAGQYTKGLRDFAETMHIEEKLLEKAQQLRETGNIGKASEYEQIYSKLGELFDRIEALIPDEKMTLKEYMEALDAGLSEIKVGVIPPGVDGVSAGDMTRSRLSGIKVLFFIGLNEGMIPKENKGSGILSDFDREYLRECGIKLSPTAREKIGEEKLYFYMNITKPSEELYITFSEVDRSGKGMRSSYFVSVLRKLLPNLATERIEQETIEAGLLSRTDALRTLSDGLSNDKDDKTRELYRFFLSDDKGTDTLEMMMKAAFFDYRADPISKAAAEAIYGKLSVMSPSRIEKYAACAYQHFLQYGLRLREREEFSFERRDMGTLLHGVLETCSRLLEDRKKTFSDLDIDEAEQLASEALDKFLSENENLVLNSSDRNKYFIVRMARILTRTVQTLTGQAKKGSFRTAEFEKEFTEDGFKGRIDRIDTTEKGQKLYVSIIDYKSGNKPFELSRVLYALDMQLVVYLNAAMKIEKIEHPKMEIKPAGIFYYHIDDPVVKASDAPSGTAEEASQKIREALRLRGIVNDDDEVIGMFDSDMGSKSEVIPVGVKKDGSFTSASSILAEDGFKVMADYVNKKSAAMKAEISDGSVKKAPAKYDGVLSCDYCSYRDVCYFDERRRGFEARKLSKVKDSGEIIDLMKKFYDGDEK